MNVHTTYALRVQYEDTDFSGYVYHANYLKFCERARSDFTRQKGIDQNANFSGPDRIAFVVRHMDCNFLRPARFGDELIVATEFIKIVGARFEAFQQVKLGEAVLFTAAVTVALIDSNGRPAPLPTGDVEGIHPSVLTLPRKVKIAGGLIDRLALYSSLTINLIQATQQCYHGAACGDSPNYVKRRSFDRFGW